MKCVRKSADKEVGQELYKKSLFSSHKGSKGIEPRRSHDIISGEGYAAPPMLITCNSELKIGYFHQRSTGQKFPSPTSFKSGKISLAIRLRAYAKEQTKKLYTVKKAFGMLAQNAEGNPTPVHSPEIIWDIQRSMYKTNKTKKIINIAQKGRSTETQGGKEKRARPIRME
ncbi:hypothetical protein K438DRAFT_1784957 [Mycena galopus ATCC 62051]|nr:hypothetical protein K438DRAFT_1784957 [Mycena galopus ATCC 62051]